MKTNPYTGEPLPENQYMPTTPNREKVQKAKDEQYGLIDPEKQIQPIPNYQDPLEQKQNSLGKQVLNNAGGILNFGFEEYANHQNVAASTAESEKQIAVSALRGAQTGLDTTGDAWGALAGAYAGAASGYIDQENDKEARVAEEDKSYRQNLDRIKNERKQSFLASQGKQPSASNTYGNQEKIYNPYG